MTLNWISFCLELQKHLNHFMVIQYILVSVFYCVSSESFLIRLKVLAVSHIQPLSLIIFATFCIVVIFRC